MSDLDRFELFTYVAQLGSLTQAAKQLDLTKASLSKQIKRLEADFAIALFARNKQRLILTTQGEALLEQCLRVKREVEEARNICKQFHAEPEGELHVVAFKHIADKLIFPKLKNFLTKYPKIRLQLDTTERVPDFFAEQIDLAVGFNLPVPNPGEVIQKSMGTTRYVLCASPTYFAEKSQPNTLDDLLEHFYIGHVSRPDDQILRLKPGYHSAIKPHLLVNTVDSMLECAKQGLGLIQLPLYVVEDYLQRGELIEVLAEFQATNTNIYYHYPKFRYMKPKVRKFIEYFLEK